MKSSIISLARFFFSASKSLSSSPSFTHVVGFFKRIVNQFALLSLMSSPRVQLDDWLKAHPELLTRLIIPAAMKWEIRDKLDQANITERVLFPGLDGLCRWQKRYYSQGPGANVSGTKGDGKSMAEQ